MRCRWNPIGLALSTLALSWGAGPGFAQPPGVGEVRTPAFS